MADWLDIIDSATDPDAPLTSELAKAWTDNVIAVAEGAISAPPVGGSTERLEVIEVTSTVSDITFTADVSSMRDVHVVASGGMSDTATILLQARVAGGTWRTLGSFVRTGGGGDYLLNSTIQNTGRLDGTNRKVVTSIYSNVESGTSSVSMLSDDNAETFSEIRLTATNFQNYGVATLYGVHPLTRDAVA